MKNLINYFCLSHDLIQTPGTFAKKKTMENLIKSEYRTTKWKNLRDRILYRDGYKCRECGRTEPEVRLSVHHLHYHSNKHIWEYTDDYLITLCDGCHCRKHGIKRPTNGWIWQGTEDLGGLLGVCDVCHTALRYEHYIFHPDWGYLTVGAKHAEELTQDSRIKETETELKKNAERLEKYLNSNRWKWFSNGRGCKLNIDYYTIVIWANKYNYRVQFEINDEDWNTKTIMPPCPETHQTLEDAKYYALLAVIYGHVRQYVISHDHSNWKVIKLNKYK